MKAKFLQEPKWKAAIAANQRACVLDEPESTLAMLFDDVPLFFSATGQAAEIDTWLFSTTTYVVLDPKRTASGSPVPQCEKVLVNIFDALQPQIQAALNITDERRQAGEPVQSQQDKRGGRHGSPVLAAACTIADKRDEKLRDGRSVRLRSVKPTVIVNGGVLARVKRVGPQDDNHALKGSSIDCRHRPKSGQLFREGGSLRKKSTKDRVKMSYHYHSC